MPSCLAFAVKIVSEEFNVMQCAPLFTPQHKEKREILCEMLHATGVAVPEAFRR